MKGMNPGVANSPESAFAKSRIWDQHGLKANFGIGAAGFEGMVS